MIRPRHSMKVLALSILLAAGAPLAAQANSPAQIRRELREARNHCYSSTTSWQDETHCLRKHIDEVIVRITADRDSLPAPVGPSYDPTPYSHHPEPAPNGTVLKQCRATWPRGFQSLTFYSDTYYAPAHSPELDERYRNLAIEKCALVSGGAMFCRGHAQCFTKNP